MRHARLCCAAGIFAATWLLADASQASFHLWYINEVFSNHDGSVQFVELFTTSSGQQFLAGHTLASSGSTFNFTNSPAPTNNHHLLLATAGFGAIAGGATPDYTIPANFFNPAGDTLNFAGGFDIKSFTPAPTDGVMSLNYTAAFSGATLAVNSPRNYSGAGGSVNLPPAPQPNGDYDENGVVDAADYVVWRKTLNESASPAGSGADGDESGTIDAGDYEFWRARFGNSVPAATAETAVAVPEPLTTGLIGVGLALFSFRRRR
jgi:hypothetical protein